MAEHDGRAVVVAIIRTRDRQRGRAVERDGRRATVPSLREDERLRRHLRVVEDVIRLSDAECVGAVVDGRFVEDNGGLCRRPTIVGDVISRRLVRLPKQDDAAGQGERNGRHRRSRALVVTVRRRRGARRRQGLVFIVVFIKAVIRLGDCDVPALDDDLLRVLRVERCDGDLLFRGVGQRQGFPRGVLSRQADHVDGRVENERRVAFHVQNGATECRNGGHRPLLRVAPIDLARALAAQGERGERRLLVGFDLNRRDAPTHRRADLGRCDGEVARKFADNKRVHALDRDVARRAGCAPAACPL